MSAALTGRGGCIRVLVLSVRSYKSDRRGLHAAGAADYIIALYAVFAFDGTHAAFWGYCDSYGINKLVSSNSSSSARNTFYVPRAFCHASKTRSRIPIQPVATELVVPVDAMDYDPASTWITPTREHMEPVHMVHSFLMLYPDHQQERKPVEWGFTPGVKGVFLRFNNVTDLKYLKLFLLRGGEPVETYPFRHTDMMWKIDRNVVMDLRRFPIFDLEPLDEADRIRLKTGLRPVIVDRLQREGCKATDVWVTPSGRELKSLKGVVSQCELLYDSSCSLARRPVAYSVLRYEIGVCATFACVEDVEYFRFELLHPSNGCMIKACHIACLDETQRDTLITLKNFV